MSVNPYQHATRMQEERRAVFFSRAHFQLRQIVRVSAHARDEGIFNIDNHAYLISLVICIF